MVGGIIFGVLFVAFMAFVITMIPVSIRRRKMILKSAGAESMVTLRHVHGLPEVGATRCELYLKPDGIMMIDTLTKRKFELSMERVFRADRQILTKRDFSVGKAVIGEALAGPIGAMLAGSSGKKKHILIIGYVSEDDAEKELAFAAQNGAQDAAMNTLSASIQAKIRRIRAASSNVVTQL